MESGQAKRVEGDCVILVRTFKGNKSFDGDDPKKRGLINDFKKRFNRVVMLDDGAGSDSLHFEYMELVDLYYKGKLLKERAHYLKPMYGRQIFTNYYKEKFGVIDDKEKLREPPPDSCVLKKLRVSWNLGCGVYPMPNKQLIRLARGTADFSLSKALKPWLVYSHKKMLATLSQPTDCEAKLKKVQVRFGNSSLPNTIGYQRKLFVAKCINNENVLTGSISSRAYNKEIRNVAAVLSPFGWGEICFRDFEAIINGSLLIKPEMGHIETWPDVYRASKTYLPVDWDGNNLVETINYVSKNITEYSDVIKTAKETYRQSLLEIDNRVLSFLEEASGTKIN